LSFLKNISSTATDAELVQHYKRSSDLQVLGALYQRYMDLVYGVCLKYLKEPEDAKDAVINLFEELVSKVQKHEIENFRSWLYQVAKNHCLMRLRGAQKTIIVKMDTGLMQSEENVHLDGVFEKEENFKQLEQCLEQLVAEQRRAIELFYLEGKCYNEIAIQTGLDWNKVRSFIQNGRRNLKLCMEKKSIETIVQK